MPAGAPPSHALFQPRLPLEASVREDHDGLVVSDCNRAALEALSTFPGASDRVLALIGPAGSGKSHLARIWARRVGAHTLDPAMMAASGQAPDHVPLVLEQADSFEAEALFYLFNRAETEEQPLLLVSRTSLDQWLFTLPDLRSRLLAVRLVRTREPDEPVLEAMLVRAFARRGILPPPDLIPYMLRRMERSGTAVTALVDQLYEAPGEVTRRSAARLLDHLCEEETADLFD